MGLWEERSLLCVTHLPTHRHRTHAGWGGGGLCGSWGLRTWAGASATLPGGGWVQENPAPCPGLILPTSLCPCTRLACQPHKALFMPGEWPGGREPQRAAGGGEEEVAHEAREHLEAFEGGPRHSPELWGWTRGRSGRLPPPLPSCWPAPSPSPSFPATAPAHPCHVKGGRRGAASREGTWAGWAGAGVLGLQETGRSSHRRQPPPPGWTTPSTQCLDYLFRTTPKLYSSLHIG